MYGQLARELSIDTETLQTLLQPSVAKVENANVSAAANPNTDKKTFNLRSKIPQARGPQRQLLPPAHRAISLLLHQPALTELINDSELELLEIPCKKLFSQILQALRRQPDLTTGELMANIDDPEEQQLIAHLAARIPGISHEGVKAEFLGVLSSLEQRALDQNINQLVEKAKKSQLNLEEKRKLQNLLARIKRDASER